MQKFKFSLRSSTHKAVWVFLFLSCFLFFSGFSASMLFIWPSGSLSVLLDCHILNVLSKSSPHFDNMSSSYVAGMPCPGPWKNTFLFQCLTWDVYYFIYYVSGPLWDYELLKASDEAYLPSCLPAQLSAGIWSSHFPDCKWIDDGTFPENLISTCLLITKQARFLKHRVFLYLN